MKMTKLSALRKLFSALALVLAVTIFTGSNSVAFAATQPATAASTAQGEFKPPKLTVVWDDADGEDMYQPRKGAMGYEKAAQLGAQYLWEIFGQSIDGKAVRMLCFSPKTEYNRDYWWGFVFNTKADINYDRYGKETGNKSVPLFTFKIDAMTGEWIGIGQKKPTQQKGKIAKTVTFEELIAMMSQPPAGIDECITIAKAFAQKHFKQTKVVDAWFIMHGFKTERKTGVGEGDANEVYEKGGYVEIELTADTGRVAIVSVDLDTKRAYFLNSTNSDKTNGHIYVTR
jgi:hypothetical protein